MNGYRVKWEYTTQPGILQQSQLFEPGQLAAAESYRDQVAQQQNVANLRIDEEEWTGGSEG